MTETPTEAFPLTWPQGRARTKFRESAVFKASFAKTRDEIVNEVRLLGATGLILSTNIPLRRDGLPYAGTAQPEDPGVAVYFTYKKRQMCFACDRWRKVEDNMRAVVLRRNTGCMTTP